MARELYEMTAPEKVVYGGAGILALCYTYGAIGSAGGNILNRFQHEEQYTLKVTPLVNKLHVYEAQHTDSDKQSDGAQLRLVHKEQDLRHQIKVKKGTIQPAPTFKDWAGDSGHYGALIARDAFAIGAVSLLAIGLARGGSSLKHILETRRT